MCAILIPLAFPWQIKSLAVLVILAFASYAICRYGLLILPWSALTLGVNVKNELQITYRNGAQLSNLVVAADSVVTPYLTVVHFYEKDASLLRRFFTRHVVVLPDALDKESYRQLRVWLRWGQPNP